MEVLCRKRKSCQFRHRLAVIIVSAKVYVVNQQSVEIGEIGIFVINGDAYIKKLGKGQLISLNEKYKPIPLNNDDSIYCCGKVIGIVE